MIKSQNKLYLSTLLIFAMLMASPAFAVEIDDSIPNAAANSAKKPC